MQIYKCIYVSVFALAVRSDVVIAFLYALLAMKRGGCQRCGSVLRGRGVGYCWWCKKYIPRMLDLMTFWPWLQKSTKLVPGGSI